jgi:methyl-accepting chemotaxis protein
MNAQAEQMKAMVSDLVSLVGGSRRGSQKGASSVAEHPKTAMHKVLSAPEKKAKKKEVAIAKAREVRPDEVIPMDDDDFKDF